MSISAEVTAKFAGGIGDALSLVELRVPQHVCLMGSLVVALSAIGVHILRIDVQRRANRLDHVIRIGESDGSAVPAPRRPEVQRTLLALLDNLIAPAQAPAATHAPAQSHAPMAVAAE
jgi:hypothetical protein